MTGSLLNRVLSTLELLSSKVEGAPLHEIAERLDLPKSAAHRLLAELVEQGYASQNGTGLYCPTARVLGLGHAWLAGHGITERVQPTLERLAVVAGDLARYAVVD